MAVNWLIFMFYFDLAREKKSVKISYLFSIEPKITGTKITVNTVC